MLRLKGRNVAENAHVKMGAYHTIEVENQRKITVIKAEWDSVSLERIELATDPYKHADLAAVVMQEGLANVCLVTSCMTIVRWVQHSHRRLMMVEQTSAVSSNCNFLAGNLNWIC